MRRCAYCGLELQQNRAGPAADSADGACIDHCSLKAKFSEICERCRLTITDCSLELSQIEWLIGLLLARRDAEELANNLARSAPLERESQEYLEK